MRRGSRLPPAALLLALPLALLLALMGCGGSSYGAAFRARHPDFAPVPIAAGASFSETLASLDVAPFPGTRVAVSELRVLRISDAAWEGIRPEQAEADAGQLAAVARLRCGIRTGLRRKQVERAAWYLFEAGRLTAFDHSAFDATCEARRSFRPSPAGQVESERALVRWVALRYPDSRPDAADRLRRGRALVEAGRLDEAQAALAAGERVVEDLAQQRKHLPEGREDQGILLLERERELRALRAVLERALREARAQVPADAPAGSGETGGAR